MTAVRPARAASRASVECAVGSNCATRANAGRSRRIDREWTRGRSPSPKYRTLPSRTMSSRKLDQPFGLQIRGPALVQQQEVHRVHAQLAQARLQAGARLARDRSGPSATSYCARVAERAGQDGRVPRPRGQPPWRLAVRASGGAAHPQLGRDGHAVAAAGKGTPRPRSPPRRSRTLAPCRSGVIPLSCAAPAAGPTPACPSRAMSSAEPKPRRDGVRSVPGSATVRIA